MLTKTQARLLSYIVGSIKDDGVPPTFERMRTAMGLRSKSGVHRLLGSLEERGFIGRPRNVRQSIVVLRQPPDAHSPPLRMHGFGHVTGTDDVLVGSLGDPPEGHHVLTVPDDSLASVGIVKGDMAMVSERSPLRPGDVAHCVSAESGGFLALATRKGLKAGDGTRLADGSYEIRGRLVALVRRY